jgi:cell division protein FtsB
MATLKKNDPVQLFRRRIGLLVLLTLVVIGASSVWGVFWKERESRALRNEAQMQLKDLQEQDAHLKSEIDRLQTARGKEAALRENYEMGKYGEKMIVIVDPATPQPIQASSTWQRWMQKLLPWW